MKGKEALFGMFCGVVGAVLTMVVGSFAPLGAQNDVSDAEFRTITCRRMNVVDSEGAIAVEIVADEIDGGMVVVRDKDSIFPLAVMGAGEYGGEVTVGGKDGPKVAISSGEQGGAVFVYGKGSVSPLAAMGVYEHIGVVSVGDTVGGSAMISTDKHGGVVGVSGKGKDTSRAEMSVNKYGSGVVSTSDKNGYRLATLK